MFGRLVVCVQSSGGAFPQTGSRHRRVCRDCLAGRGGRADGDMPGFNPAGRAISHFLRVGSVIHGSETVSGEAAVLCFSALSDQSVPSVNASWPCRELDSHWLCRGFGRRWFCGGVERHWCCRRAGDRLALPRSWTPVDAAEARMPLVLLKGRTPSGSAGAGRPLVFRES